MSAQDPPCPERIALLQGLVDGELDAANAADCERHAATCAGCAGELARIRSVRASLAQGDIRWRAPDDLRARVLTTIAQEAGSEATFARHQRNTWQRMADFLRRWSLAPSLAALAASLFLVLAPPQGNTPLQQELVGSHVRSLLAEHLTDVATSDQHTVKPWFIGKIDFAPPVIDLADRQFPLAGGRVDYVNGRVVAALIYRHHGHVINLFIWPASNPTGSSAALEGYSLINWSQAGLTFWAVSDLDPVRLKEFQEDFAAQAPR